MSKRTKGSKAAGNDIAPVSESLAVKTSSEGLTVKAEDRIYVDNSNPSDLKMTCDDAVERVSKLTSRLQTLMLTICTPQILTKSSISASLAPAPSPYSTNGSGASSPATAASPSSSTTSLPRAPIDTTLQPFPPFKASHFHTDLKLMLGFLSSTVMIGTCAWAYLVEKDWQKNKIPCGIAVVV